MNGWLIAGWCLALLVLAAIWSNTRWPKMQRRVAGQRPGMDRDTYAEALAADGVSMPIATTLYDALISNCVKGVLPHPDDGLIGFYYDDPEDMEDLIEQLYDELGLPQPKRYAPILTPHLESARQLAIYLQSEMMTLRS